jgi:hypothetical protein
MAYPFWLFIITVLCRTVMPTPPSDGKPPLWLAWVEAMSWT